MRQGRAIWSISFARFDAADDIRPDAAHDMAFLELPPILAVLLANPVPAGEYGGREAGRIDGKLVLHLLQRHGGELDQAGEYWFQFRLVEVLEDRVVMRRVVQVSELLDYLEIGSKF